MCHQYTAALTMKTFIGYRFIRLPLLILLVCKLAGAIAQNKPIPLQHVVFKDKVLERNLMYFVHETKAKVVIIILEKRDNAYLYSLSKKFFFEPIEDYSTPNWGQWRNQIIMFYSGPELAQVCTISDTTAFSNLLSYVRPLLPTMPSIKVVGGKKIYNTNITKELEWVFKIENGRQVWLKDNQGYDSRDFPQMPDPK